MARALARSEDAIATLGTAGKKHGEDIRKISAVSARNFARSRKFIRKQLEGLTKKERDLVGSIVYGRPQHYDESFPDIFPRYEQRADAILRELDRVRERAEAAGLSIADIESDGTVTPGLNDKGVRFLQDIENKGKSSPMFLEWWAMEDVEDNFESSGAAIEALKDINQRRVDGDLSYVEDLQNLKLPTSYFDYDVTNTVPMLQTTWQQIVAAETWGMLKDGRFKTVERRAKQIEKGYGKAAAQSYKDYVYAHFRQEGVPEKQKKWAGYLKGAQYYTKLALSPITIIRNMTDRIAKGLGKGGIGANIKATMKYPPFINKFMKSARRLEQEFVDTGIVLGHTSLSEFTSNKMDMPGKKTLSDRAQRLVGWMFSESEKGNQTYIALVHKLQLEAHLETLLQEEGGTGPVNTWLDTVSDIFTEMPILRNVLGTGRVIAAKTLKQQMTDAELDKALEMGRINNTLIKEILHRTTVDSTFPITMASKRMWWDTNPLFQIPAQFKTYAADNIRFGYKEVALHAVKTGDYSVFIRYTLGILIAGELAAIFSDLWKDQEKSMLITTLNKDFDGLGDWITDEDVRDAAFRSMRASGLMGIIADLGYGLGSFLGGPSGSSAENLIKAVDMAVESKSPGRAAEWLVFEDASPPKQVRAMTDKIDRKWINKDNLTQDYSTWQFRSRSYKPQVKEVGPVARALGKTWDWTESVLLGPTDYKATPTTLPYKMIARQILVGDPEDAADIMIGLYKNADAKDLPNVMQGIDASVRINSPFGDMPAKDLPLFLSKYPPEEAVVGIKTQEQWMKTYHEAKTIAFRRMKEDGMIEDLEARYKEYIGKVKDVVDKPKLNEIKRLYREAE
jgi:hypothetical protein